ncbi:MAG: NAD(P)H-dependent oxidoreductase [Bacteroidales bacterium]|nr:NAD(P)H-dependent oxidoreductase [Bacteroidales bacterium]
MKLVYINCCMRPESRTLRIAEPLIAELSKRYEIETISLEGSDYPCVDSKVLIDRNNGIVPEEYADTARRIAAADRIVIAAPFWDMSFPSILKVFFENMSLFGITFNTNERECYGLCRCDKVLYITTRGMNITSGSPLEQATPYLNALSFLWGLGEIITVSAQNLDYSSPEEIETKIHDAIRRGLDICKEF